MVAEPHQQKGVNLRSRAEKNENLPIAGFGTYPTSSRQNLSKECHTFPAQEPGKNL